MKKIIGTLLIIFAQISVFSQEVENKTKDKNTNVEWEAGVVYIKDTVEICNTQWAYKVLDYSSQFSKTKKSAKMVLGWPNAVITGGESDAAWSVKLKNGQEEPKPAFIKVAYEKPMKIRQVVVCENNAPGAITEIIIYGTKKGEQETIYKSEAKAINKKTRVLNVFLPDLSKFYVSAVEVKLDQVKVPGWNQIDAIGISDCKDTVKIKINLVPKLVFNSKPENLGQNINSIYDEVAPFISPDGKTLYFVRKKHPDNVGGFKDEDDIWYSTLVDSQWTPAKNIGYPLNNKYSNFVQSVTPDGNALLLGNVYNKDGSMSAGVSLSYKTRNGWSFPEKQIIDNFYNNSPYANYFLSNNGRVLLMAIERKDSKGGLDLYVSFLKDENHWSEPKNLGPIVNTCMNDYSPFLAADGVTLYYSTEGYPGYGKADIFVTKRLDDTWQNWTLPQNLGPVLNSNEADAKYNIPASGKYAYFSSEKNSIGGSDIFRIKLPEKAKPKPVVLISGRVLNDRTNEPVAAKIYVEELPSGKEVAIARTDPKTGAFKIILPAGKKYGFRAVAKGFFEVNKNIDLTDITEYTEIEDEIMRIGPVEVGTVVRLNNIFFEFAKAILKPESFPELNRTVEFLKNNPNVEIEIAGHTDNIGSEITNLKLSQKRAQAVADYLIEHGIDPKRLIVKGYGESRPIAFNNTEEGRAMNRRVEFKVLKK